MTKRILIMGLPGSGKSTLAHHLSLQLFPNVLWLNADEVRAQFDDWDFSLEGRLRQAQRMHDLADRSDKEYVICDFIAPLEQMREIFDADFTIWVDTIKESRFQNTDSIFQPPRTYNFHVTEQNAVAVSKKIARHILEHINTEHKIC